MNRSATCRPYARNEEWSRARSGSRSERFVELASAMIAYAGDEQSLRAIAKLIGTLTKAVSAVGRAHTGKRRELAKSLRCRISEDSNWATKPFPGSIQRGQIRIGIEPMQRAWAEAMLDKYGKVPGDSEWATDPIVFRLNDRASPELRQSVLRSPPKLRANERKGEAWKNLNTTVKNPMKKVSHRHPTKSPMLWQTSCEASNC